MQPSSTLHAVGLLPRRMLGWGRSRSAQEAERHPWIAEVARRFALLDDDGIDAGVVTTLDEALRHFGAERALVADQPDEMQRFAVARAWRPSAPAVGPELRLDGHPRLLALLREGLVLRLDGRTRLPEGAHAEWQAIRAAGVGAALAAPMRAAGFAVGTLCVSTRARDVAWTDDQAVRLEALADILAGALLHHRDRRVLRDSEALSQAVLSSVAAEVAVLDAGGSLLAANTQWRQVAITGTNPGIAAVHALRGRIEKGGAAVSGVASRVHAALDAVLRGERRQAQVEYGWQDEPAHRWSELRLHHLERPGGGAVIAHIDITTRKRTEAEVQRNVHELAHLNMISGMGELAASVAHELNQPLTAVLSNAQAARRMLAGPAPEMDELRSILDDIIEQNKRAGEVIRRIRRLLKKEEFDLAPLDLGLIVRDVVGFLASQAALSGVTMAAEIPPDLPHVRGDRVQLQQVFLNLALNAIHASSDEGRTRGGRVSLVAGLEDEWLVLVVRDTGPGIAADAIGRIFEPFFTTRSEGLGVGLSISRSIVELHRGRIEARNLPAGGAEFSVRLPLDRSTP